MPVAFLQFRLPEEEVEHADALNGSHWHSAMFALDQALRNKVKYSSTEGMTREQAKAEQFRVKAFIEVRKMIFEAVDERGLADEVGISEKG